MVDELETTLVGRNPFHLAVAEKAQVYPTEVTFAQKVYPELSKKDPETRFKTTILAGAFVHSTKVLRF